MATVFKRDASPYWFACYADRLGKQQRRSTKLTERSSALRLAVEWEQVERLAKSGQATTAQFQKVVSEVAERVMGETLPSPTVKAYFDDWLESVRRRCSPKTQERYGNSTRLFTTFLGATSQQPLRCLTPQMIERFLNHRLDQGLAPRTVILDVKVLGVALRRAQIYGLIERNPVPAVKLPKNVGSEKGVFAPDEVQKLLNAAPNPEWKTLILLGFYLGARLGDCARMRWEHVDTDNGLMVFQQQKTGQTVRVPLHLNLVHHLHELSTTHASGFLCPALVKKGSAAKAACPRRSSASHVGLGWTSWKRKEGVSGISTSGHFIRSATVLLRSWRTSA